MESLISFAKPRLSGPFFAAFELTVRSLYLSYLIPKLILSFVGSVCQIQKTPHFYATQESFASTLNGLIQGPLACFLGIWGRVANEAFEEKKSPSYLENLEKKALCWACPEEDMPAVKKWVVTQVFSRAALVAHALLSVIDHTARAVIGLLGYVGCWLTLGRFNELKVFSCQQAGFMGRVPAILILSALKILYPAWVDY